MAFWSLSAAASSCKNFDIFSKMSVITEDIYLQLRLIVYYQKGNPYK